MKNKGALIEAKMKTHNPILKRVREAIYRSEDAGITETKLSTIIGVSENDIAWRLGKLLYKGLIEIETIDGEKVIRKKGLPKNKEPNKQANGIRHISTSYENYKVNKLEKYIGSKQVIKDAEMVLKIGENLMLTGDRGIGKSLLTASIAKNWNIPRYTFNCSHGVTESDLVGYYVDFNTFVDGMITRAVKTACGGQDAMLVIEEINAINPGIAMMLHSLLDFQHQLEIKPTGEVLKLNGAGKLYVVATANVGYEGLFTLNRALHSRFIEKNIPFPNDNILKEILRVNGIKKEEEQHIVIGLVKAMKASYEKGELQDYPTIREMVQYAKIRQHRTIKETVYMVFFDKFVKSKVAEDVVKNIMKSLVS